MMIKKLIIWVKYFFYAFLFIVIGFFVFDKIYPVDTSSLQDLSRVVKSEEGTWLYTTTNKKDKWRFPTDLRALDPRFVDSLLQYEDHRFYSHYGVDPLAVIRAVWQLLTQGRIVSGASTITMQLARLLEPKPRTLMAKLTQMFRALQLEWYYSKDEILAAYLTLAPYGGNVEGIVAASMRYFAKYPYALSASQTALLVAMPQSPERNRPDRDYEKSREVRDKVLHYLKKRGLITSYEFKEALDEALPRKSKAFPRNAPHLAQKLLSKSQENIIETTLHATLQQQLEQWALSKETVLDKGTTLAVLVVRNKDGAVQAYMGSHDMFSRSVSGYVDMIQAIRSPGSTLKPFIYTYGFESHLIHPNTKILDKETRFGNYRPHNFSHRYSGEVTLQYALQHSLNIPAVKILNRVGVDAFVERISSLSGSLHIPKKRATLPIALGGIGISIWQLTQLYMALANDGHASALHVLPQKGEETKEKELFEEEAVRMTTAILRDTETPEGFMDQHKQIAYKTGTSYGYRDAWTVAYTKAYTVTVWVGKPDNSIQLKKTGRTTAAPLAFEVMSLLHSFGLYEPWQWQADYLGYSVPEGLEYFDREEKERDATLRFLYPQENERFMSAGCSDVIVEVMVENGSAPYFWYVDNEAKAYEGNRVNLSFTYGGHTIQVIDSTGTVKTRNIWVNKPEC